MNLLLTVLDGQTSIPWAFVAVYVVGFIAAVAIGSFAWYSSKRPPGWENAKRPDYLPDLNPKPDDNSEA